MSIQSPARLEVKCFTELQSFRLGAFSVMEKALRRPRRRGWSLLF